VTSCCDTRDSRLDAPQLCREEDVRSGEILFWLDTVASLKRIFTALVLSASIGLALGLAIGAVPLVRARLRRSLPRSR